MTAPGAYIWHPEYGAGIPQKIGSVFNEASIRSLITSQIYLEEIVAKQPAPVIYIRPFSNGITIDIQYFMANSGTQNVLSFDVSR